METGFLAAPSARGIAVLEARNTFVDFAVVEKLVRHTYVFDHVRMVMPQMLESSTVVCGRR